MTLLIISPDYASHLLPLATLGTAWRDAGERVVVATGPATASIVESFGFERVNLQLGKGSNPGVIRAEDQPRGEDDALRGFFDATRQGMIATLAFQPERLAARAPQGFSLATDVADWLVKQRVPFAEAHEIAGKAVQYCEGKGIELTELTAADLPGIDERLTAGVLGVLSVAGSINARDGRGGTAQVRVAEQLGEVEAKLAAHRRWVTD